MMFSLTPTVVHSRSPFDMSISTRTTAPVPTLRSSTRTRKSSSSMSSSCGYSFDSALRSALSKRAHRTLPLGALDVPRALGDHLDRRLGQRRCRPVRSSTWTR